MERNALRTYSHNDAAPSSHASHAMTAPKPSLLSCMFNRVSLGSAGAGAVVGMAVKMGALAAFGSPLLAIGIGALAIAMTGTAVRRAFDIHDHNKGCTAENGRSKARYAADFFKAEKTGHQVRSYQQQLLLGTVCACAGGLIGLNIAEWLSAPENSAPPAPAPDHVAITDPDITRAAPLPAPQTDIVDLTPAEPPADDPPAFMAPAPEAPVIVTPAPEAMLQDVATPESAPVILPTIEERVAATMDEVRALLPENPAGKLAETLNRIDSPDYRIQAQALKDLGYFFANGFRGLVENDTVANSLYELSLTVSDGQNMQAAHDLGYHLLYGKGTSADPARAFELLSRAHENGHRLSAPMLDYMHKAGLAPRP